MAERSEAVEEQAVRDGSAAYSVEAEVTASEDVPPGYKRTEVGVIPEDWSVAALAYFVSALHAGVSVNSSAAGQPIDDVPSVLKTSCIQAGIFFPDHAKPITPKDRSRAKLSPKAETILISRMNTPDLVGESGFVEKDYEHLFLPDRIWMTIFRQAVRFSPRWLAYILSSPAYRKYLKEIATGTSGSMKNIAKGSLLGLKVPCPAEKEQRAIATALSDADALIESLDRLIAKKRAIKQAAMQQLLTGQTRLPGFTDEWETKRLGDIAEMSSGGTPPSAVSAYYGGDIPWVAIADMTEGGKTLTSTERNLTERGLSVSAARLFPAGTVLYAMYASLGECSIAAVEMCSSQAILGIGPRPSLRAEFLYYWLLEAKERIKLLGQQGTQSNLNKGMVQDFRIPLPSIAEQSAIATALSDMDTEIETVERRRHKARQIKQGMMQQLLTGRVRLVTPERVGS